MNHNWQGGNTWFALMLLGVILFVMATCMWPREAVPHDALPTAAEPLGWQYDLSCCSGRDCHQLADEEVKITPQGYEWDGEIFPMTSHKLRSSPDGYYHGCKMSAGTRPCLYTPGFGS